ncbi:Hypothetical protein IALB_0220 [Ignavibacterium album JCM 16511]|uniref:Lipoprotein n=1 Tax=Ignavibacterium album (strain DSM 19864 / JCM 16511 / NBRC 101810 / Mat9-16) TaxID=945713 RepID=I0AG25_IGNAJ|nr:hypothetical protein [Ignavibacterium album]AFH47932.1 Hypothetical protein IALB_0220 [Ignavibacterium album JCM 16511]
MKQISSTKEFEYIFLSISFSLLLLTACSSGEIIRNSETATVDKTFIFRDGNDNYRVEFDGDKIKSIYKNNQKLPDNEIDNYKDLVIYELKNLTKDSYSNKDKSKRIKIFIDRDSAERDSSESDEQESDFPMSFRFKIDDDFLKDMRIELDSMLKELKDKDFEIRINPDDMKSEMHKFKEYFKNIIPPEPPKFDRDKFKDEMKKFREEMKKLDSIDIDLKGKFMDLRERNIEIIELKKNVAEYKKTKSFVNELKEELVKDGYLDSIDSELRFKMNDDKISVNGQDLPKELVSKYKEIFRKHHERNFEGQILIEID